MRKQRREKLLPCRKLGYYSKSLHNMVDNTNTKIGWREAMIGWPEVIQIAMALHNNRPLTSREISEALKGKETELKTIGFESENIGNNFDHCIIGRKKDGQVVQKGLIQKNKARLVEEHPKRFALLPAAYEEICNKYSDFINKNKYPTGKSTSPSLLSSQNEQNIENKQVKPNSIGWKEAIQIAIALRSNFPLSKRKIQDTVIEKEEVFKGIGFESKSIRNSSHVHNAIKGSAKRPSPGLIGKGKVVQVSEIPETYALLPRAYEEIFDKYSDFINKNKYTGPTDKYSIDESTSPSLPSSQNDQNIENKQLASPQPTPNKPANPKGISYLEKDIHPLLACFAYHHLHFQKALCMTINHTEAKDGKVKEEWTYPDMVGISMSTYKEDIYKFVKERFHINRYTLLSFELKKELSTSNVRKYYMQAVANSSWANEGYLVATTDSKASDEDKIRAELQLLHNTYGIGVIRIFVPKSEEEVPSGIEEFVSKSQILHLARSTEIDLGVINKLYELYSDKKGIRGFLQAVSSVGVGAELGSNKVLTKEKDEIASDSSLRNHFKEMFS